MTIRVPYLSKEAIERDAEALLAEYAEAGGATLQPPIPIEDIVEKHLKLRVDFDDLHQVLGVPKVGPEPDILGAIWVDKREIFIDQSLDPELRPAIEGRYRFTLAHEGGGHWRLHRRYLRSDPAQESLFGGPTKPAVVCRRSEAKEWVEWQADYHASCTLMPKTMVLEAWRERFGDSNPRILRRKDRIPMDDFDDPGFKQAVFYCERDRDDRAMERSVRPLAEMFKVSAQAMRIRLERIGLLHREMPRQMSFAEAR